MRGDRFSESLAREAMASLPDKFVASFMAMTPEVQDLCIAKFNGFFASAPTYWPRRLKIEVSQ